MNSDVTLKKYWLIDRISAMALTGGSDSNFLLGGHRLPTTKVDALQDFYDRSLEWVRLKGTKVVSTGIRGLIKRADYYDGRVHIRNVKQFWIRVWKPFIGSRYNVEVEWSVILADEVQITRIALSPSYVMDKEIEYRKGIVELLQPHNGGLKVVGKVGDLSYEVNIYPDGERDFIRMGEIH